MRATYVKFSIHGLTGEPMIYGTMGKGLRVHSTPIYANPSMVLAVADNEDMLAWTEGGFALTNDREALTQLEDDGVMADILWLQQTTEQRWTLMHDLDRLRGLEQVVATGRQNWDIEYRKMEERRQQTISRLCTARVNSQIRVMQQRSAYPYRTPTSPHPQSWTTSPATSNNLVIRRRCKYCQWTHKSGECDTPHHLCSC